MTRISVELVPRDVEVLKEEVKTIKEKLSDVELEKWSNEALK
jgi:methylenetetrahydrofolate reductase (NADPH)